MNMSISEPERVVYDWRDMLTNRPPGTRAWVDRCATKHVSSPSLNITLPELQMHCDGPCNRLTHCRGTVKSQGKLYGGLEASHFSPSDVITQHSPPQDALVLYRCESCGRAVKSYSLRFWVFAKEGHEESLGEVEKLAEYPPFSPKAPSKLLTMIREDRDFYLKGRRAEVAGMGIAAFAYYRRVVENHKNRFLDEIIRVSRHLNASEETIQSLLQAKADIQFSNAVDRVKDAIPSELYIKTHNPLTLLHSALSQGLHNESDDECLRIAADIRVVLFELVERLVEAMKDQCELDQAIRRLVNRSQSS